MERVRNVLQSLSEVNKAPEIYFERFLAVNWSGVVGPRLGGQTRSGPLHSGCLTVYVRSSVWCRQLRGLEGEFVSRIRSELGRPVVQEVKLLAAPERFRRPGNDHRSKPEPPAGDESSVAEGPAIRNDGLRRQFVRTRLEHHRLWQRWQK
ncbi:MAG: DUF721 domain-containing protein [Acidobacteria bacterium]|nr:DUF721 domain-containing protein [Acidobacteriota bacterium]